MSEKVVYDFWHDGRCIVNGQGKKERYNTLCRALSSGKLQKSVHNKVFVILLFRQFYGKEAITHNCRLSLNPEEEERIRHSMWGGNKGNWMPEFEEEMRKRHPTFAADFPDAYWVMRNWAMHGDACSTSRMNTDGMPPKIREGIVRVLGNVFP